MPPRPDDPYNPNASVLPETQAPNDYIRSQASPADFGAQVGGAMHGVGEQVSQVANQYAGMMNESLATQAETDYMAKLGSVVGDYKSLQGYDAVQKRQQAADAITQLRQDMMSQLPTGAAQRAFTTLALRHEAYALSDVNTYASQATRQFDAQTAVNSAQAATQQAGIFPVASNDSRFNYQIGTVRAQVARVMQNRGYSDLMTQNPDGSLGFDTSSQNGLGAKGVYDELVSKYEGDAWMNRIHALTDDPTHGSPQAAERVFEANKDSIPAEAQMKISAYLKPKLSAYQTDGLAGTQLRALDDGYQDAVAGSGTRVGLANNVANLGASKAPWDGKGAPLNGLETFATPESGVAAAVKNIETKAVENGGFIDLQTLIKGHPDGNGGFVGGWAPQDDGKTPMLRGNNPDAYIARVSSALNIDPTTPLAVADKNQMAAVVKALHGVEKGGVKFGDDVFQRGADAAINGTALPQAQQQAQPETTYYSKADYYKDHYDETIEATRAAAMREFQGDPVKVDAAVARVTQQLGAQIRQQEQSYQSDRDTIWRGINGTDKSGPPVTVAQLRAMGPEYADTWDRVAGQQPQFAHEVQTKLLVGNAKATDKESVEYGTGYWDAFKRINLPDGDPNKITNLTQLVQMTGPGGALTRSGLKQAASDLQGKGSVEGETEAAYRNTLFQAARDELVKAKTEFGQTDPRGEEQFLAWQVNADQAIAAAKSKGKSLAEIYTPGSADYAGKTISSFRRNPAQIQADLTAANADAMMGAPINQPEPPGFFGRLMGAPDLTTADGVRAAYAAGKIDRQTAFGYIKAMQQPKLTPAASE